MERIVSFLHTCERSDSMPKIAAEYGFSDYRTIWELPENAALRERRPNPNVLTAGDKVFIPDKQDKSVTAATGAKHSYTLKGKPERLRIKLLDATGAPLASARVQLTVDGKPSTVTTDGDGVLDQVVPPGAPEAVLESDRLARLVVHIGDLDPVELSSGLMMRLFNLGYLPGIDERDVDEHELRFGIQLFQADHQLSIDGDNTAALQAKVKDVHGC
jgi:hypothetical protein